MDILFTGLYENSAGLMTLSSFIICLLSALLMGLFVTLVFRYRTNCSRSFLESLALLPGIICLIIMMASGSLGVGVAIAGCFSLIRFRSNPGTSKEITAVLFASAIGIACGMGYPVFGLIFTLVISAFYLAYQRFGYGIARDYNLRKTLRITVPEDLEYSSMFNEVFDRYTSEAELVRVKTSNMGSLNRLTYNITLKSGVDTKKLLDELRIMNGNLEISIAVQETETHEF